MNVLKPLYIMMKEIKINILIKDTIKKESKINQLRINKVFVLIFLIYSQNFGSLESGNKVNDLEN